MKSENKFATISAFWVKGVAFSGLFYLLPFANANECQLDIALQPLTTATDALNIYCNILSAISHQMGQYYAIYVRISQ